MLAFSFELSYFSYKLNKIKIIKEREYEYGNEFIIRNVRSTFV